MEEGGKTNQLKQIGVIEKKIIEKKITAPGIFLLQILSYTTALYNSGPKNLDA